METALVGVFVSLDFFLPHYQMYFVYSGEKLTMLLLISGGSN